VNRISPAVLWKILTLPVDSLNDASTFISPAALIAAAMAFPLRILVACPVTDTVTGADRLIDPDLDSLIVNEYTVPLTNVTGADTIVGTNATINVTGSLSGSTAAVYNNLDLGTIATGTNVTVNASTFQGGLTVTATSGNVNITGGSGADVLGGGVGTDVINGGAGNDQITGGAGADQLSGGTGRDAFVVGTNSHSSAAAMDKISDFGKVTTATTTIETAAMTAIASFQATATAKGGADADMLQLSATATLGGAQASTDVTGADGSFTGKTINAVESAKGIITISGADVALVDTLAEWTAIANIMAAAGNNVVGFEFNGNTYVFQQSGTDTLVELTGVTGVTGITLVGSSVAAAVGDIFVL
jgi:hypothetical protein